MGEHAFPRRGLLWLVSAACYNILYIFLINMINISITYDRYTSSVKPPATTPPPPGQCGNSKWIPNGDYCYTVSVNQGRSWPEANYQCQKLGMELASIHSQAEMTFVLNLVTQAKVTDPHYKPNVFIGLSKNPLGM